LLPVFQPLFSFCLVIITHCSINVKVAERPRAVTGWDQVLDEMRWMAADFHQERMWKRAVARLQSSAVQVKDKAKGLVAICRSFFPFIFFHTIHYRTSHHTIQYLMRLGQTDVY
jgi:hypothetical protein